MNPSLTFVWRMNKSIMQWPNTMFYRDKLSAAPLVLNHNLSGLDNVTRSGRLTDPVLVLIDTSETSSRHETISKKSFSNKTEVVLVMDHLTALIGWWSSDFQNIPPRYFLRPWSSPRSDRRDRSLQLSDRTAGLAPPEQTPPAWDQDRGRLPGEREGGDHHELGALK